MFIKQIVMDNTIENESCKNKKQTHKTNGFGVNVKIHLTNRYVTL